ncbi:sodium:solute symporter family transporter, partial [Terribacillus saccharophilus]|uniref:sodium:solute symporter family transporter n=1 Tax=Terribacillus saccharophilus TaxID=361277 RepID=UPI002DCF87A3|nr:solute:sodium symporter family transporter [Terribacillus saccharophilus]
SVATLLVLDIYQPVFEPNASDEKLIKVSKILGIIIALVSFFVAPFLMYAPDGLWNLIRQFTGFFNIPILVIVLMGMIFKRVPASAAKVVIVFHVFAYYMMVWGFRQIFDWDPGINYIHVYGILLAIEVAFMLIMAKVKPLRTIKPVFYAENGEDHLVPWKHAIPVSITLIFSIVIFYVIFSPIGLAYEEAAVSNWFWPVIAILLAANVVLYIVSIKTWHQKYHNYVEKQTETARKARLSGD